MNRKLLPLLIVLVLGFSVFVAQPAAGAVTVECATSVLAGGYYAFYFQGLTAQTEYEFWVDSTSKGNFTTSVGETTYTFWATIDEPASGSTVQISLWAATVESVAQTLFVLDLPGLAQIDVLLNAAPAILLIGILVSVVIGVVYMVKRSFR